MVHFELTNAEDRSTRADAADRPNGGYYEAGEKIRCRIPSARYRALLDAIIRLLCPCHPRSELLSRSITQA